MNYYKVDSASKLAKNIINRLQSENKLSFPLDIASLINEYNIKVYFKDFEMIEGLLLREEDCSLMFIKYDSLITRQRFTMAHELGHYLLHDDITTSLEVQNRTTEKEADDFASNLLMPTNELIKQIELHSMDGFVGMKECFEISTYFGVSFEACVKTIMYRLDRFAFVDNNKNLTRRINHYKSICHEEVTDKWVKDLESLKIFFKFILV